MLVTIIDKFNSYVESSRCMGGNECCSDTNKCGEQEGDCDSDVDCIDGLLCGEDNCRRNNDLWWDPSDDCCEMPKSIH